MCYTCVNYELQSKRMTRMRLKHSEHCCVNGYLPPPFLFAVVLSRVFVPCVKLSDSRISYFNNYTQIDLLKEEIYICSDKMITAGKYIFFVFKFTHDCATLTDIY